MVALETRVMVKLSSYGEVMVWDEGLRLLEFAKLISRQHRLSDFAWRKRKPP